MVVGGSYCFLDLVVGWMEDDEEDVGRGPWKLGRSRWRWADLVAV